MYSSGTLLDTDMFLCDLFLFFLFLLMGFYVRNVSFSKHRTLIYVLFKWKVVFLIGPVQTVASLHLCPVLIASCVFD